MEQKEIEDTFKELSLVNCDVVKKGNLNYVSWAEAWKQLKLKFPKARYLVYENEQGMPYFADSTGGFVKVSVIVNELHHVVFLPIMDFRNKSLKQDEITTFDINKAIQRALTKAIAMHGLGLYVYNGEALPEKDTEV